MAGRGTSALQMRPTTRMGRKGVWWRRSPAQSSMCPFFVIAKCSSKLDTCLQPGIFCPKCPIKDRDLAMRVIFTQRPAAKVRSTSALLALRTSCEDLQLNKVALVACWEIVQLSQSTSAVHKWIQFALVCISSVSGSFPDGKKAP